MVFLLSVFVPYALMGFYLSGCAKPRGSLDPGLVKIWFLLEFVKSGSYYHNSKIDNFQFKYSILSGNRKINKRAKMRKTS